MPNGGHLWVVGPDNEIGHWYPHSHFEQVTLIYNQHALRLFYTCMHHLTLAGTRKVNVSYTSRALLNETGISGEIRHPAFNSKRFLGISSGNRGNAAEVFKAGKATRDVRYKHHPDDPSLYNAILKNDVLVELVGATCIKDCLTPHPNLYVREEISQSKMAGYLRGIDCLIYRTSNRKPEGFGLCIVEAMAIGLPVIAGRSGGYADIIRSGDNGFLFDTNEEALEKVLLLKENPDLRKQIGDSAIQTISQLFIR
jgi:hypothetical protein